MNLFTRQQAEQLATEITERYGFQVNVQDQKFPESMGLTNYTFIALWYEGELVSTFETYDRWQAFKKMAVAIVQTDQDLSQIQDMEACGLIENDPRMKMTIIEG